MNLIRVHGQLDIIMIELQYQGLRYRGIEIAFY